MIEIKDSRTLGLSSFFNAALRSMSGRVRKSLPLS